MTNYIKTIYLFAAMQLKRNLRDPLTTVILIGLPVVLLCIFGAFLNDTSNITLRTAVVNHSNQQFAKDFEKALNDTGVIEVKTDFSGIDEAKEKMVQSEYDTVIELPESFGTINEAGRPSGSIKVYYDAADEQGSQIVNSVMGSIIDGFNTELVGVEPPLAIERESINVNDVQAIAVLFSLFSGMALLMVGIFGVASSIPADKKAKILRRMHVTPLKASQLSLGTMLCFAVIGVIIIALMVAIALLLFGMKVQGDFFTLFGFMSIGLVLMLGFGLAIAGLAKNSTQAEVMGQIIFLASLALGGVWIPTALMPEVLQGIVSFMPLNPIIEGAQAIIVDGATFSDLASQLAIIGVWILVVYIIGFKTFRWE